MEYIILNITPVINGESVSNFINIHDVNDTNCNVSISNREATIYNVAISNGDIESSVNDYFVNISDVL